MQKIIPSLWFDDNCEEAMGFYTSIFPNSKIVSIQYYPEGVTEGPLAGMGGKVLTGIFELNGYRFMALDGGPIFTFNPSISFHVKCRTKEEVDKLWDELSGGGKVMMPLGSYPFSEWHGWCRDRYGVSWQVTLVDEIETNQNITPVLMFTERVYGKAEEAITFYASVFTNTGAEVLARYEEGEEPDEEGTVKYATFTLEGQEFGAMDSAREHGFTFNEAISLYVECADQEEVDRLWKKLSSVPEAEQCGWLKDPYGVSWQIVPKRMGELLSDPNIEKSGRVMEAMLLMKKIDIAALEAAYESES